MRSSFITYVWLLSVLIHPLVWTCWFSIIYGQWEMDIFGAALIAGFILSIPVYITCLLISEWMLPCGRSITHQFFSWIFWISGVVFLETLAVMLFFESDWSVIGPAFQVSIAPVIATFLSTGLFYKQLIELNIHLSNPEHNDALDTTAAQ